MSTLTTIQLIPYHLFSGYKSSKRGVSPRAPPTSVIGSDLVQILAIKHSCLHSRAQQPCHAQKLATCFSSTQLLLYLTVFLIFLHCSPSLGDSAIDGLFMSCHSELFIFCALTSYEFLQSLLTTAKKLRWPKQTVALSFEHKHSYLENSLTGASCSFSKITTVAFPLGPITAPSCRLWARFMLPDVNSVQWSSHQAQ